MIGSLTKRVNYITTRGETATVCRECKGYYKDGHYVKGKVSKHTIKASIQPATGKEILQLAEGDRMKQVLSVYTYDEIKVNDTMIRDSLEYEMQKVEKRMNHYKGTAVLKDDEISIG